MSRHSVNEAVREFRERIQEFENCTVIVEGKKDRKALEALGFSKVIILNKPLYEIVESIKEKRVLLLTDLDKEGKQIYSKLKKDLDKRGIIVDDCLRNLLFRTELRQIEGLTSYLENFV
jgi:5S rRNA maturation endonuclease (ribonuclease M5)